VTQDSSQEKTPRALSETQIAGLMTQSGCLVVAMVLAAVVAGIWLDKVLNTRPILTLLLVLGSVPVTLFVLFRMATQAISAVKPAANHAKKVLDDDDDDQDA
jgi:F0F1-type ATP synthase assembly protein I